MRSSWAAPLYDSSPALATIDPATAVGVIDAAGRTTVAFFDPTLRMTTVSSALPRPLRRAPTHLTSTSPRVHVAVGCASTWTDAASITYTWLRDGHTIAGATTATYSPALGDRGHALACTARAANGAGATGSASVAHLVH